MVSMVLFNIGWMTHYRGDKRSDRIINGGNELVQQNGDDPSVFSDRAWGLHHTAYFAPDLDAELARLETQGFPTRMTARAGQVKFAFADANASLGHYFEIYEDEPGLRRFYAMVEAASQDWDGREPLRPLERGR